jgi:hypothetical protein
MSETDRVRQALNLANAVRLQLEGRLPLLRFMFWTPKIALVALGVAATVVASTGNSSGVSSGPDVGALAIGAATAFVVGIQNLDFAADLPLVLHWIDLLHRFRRDAALQWIGLAATSDRAAAAEQIVSQLRVILSEVRT